MMAGAAGRPDRAGEPFSHCPSCGRRLPDAPGWPRRYPRCGRWSYRNPLPVAVLAVPIEDRGVLMVRRATPPVGLALPSGYVELGERWQDAAARELAEETGIAIDPASVRELMVRTDEDRALLLVFATVPRSR